MKHLIAQNVYNIKNNIHSGIMYFSWILFFLLNILHEKFQKNALEASYNCGRCFPYQNEWNEKDITYYLK